MQPYSALASGTRSQLSAAIMALGNINDRTYSLASDTRSLSSSDDEEAIGAVAADADAERKAGGLGDGNRDAEREVLQEDARRAEDNHDDDDGAVKEERDAEDQKSHG